MEREKKCAKIKRLHRSRERSRVDDTRSKNFLRCGWDGDAESRLVVFLAGSAAAPGAGPEKQNK
jgi:hypothetical protein